MQSCLVRPTLAVSTVASVPFPPEPTMHAAGCGGMLFNPGLAIFDMEIQQRLWALKDEFDHAAAVPGVTQAVLGVNNLLVLFDPFRIALEAVKEQTLALWGRVKPKTPASQEFVIPVEYGGPGGEDLPVICQKLGMEPREFVALHSGARYTVACLGAMAGFAYMVGLPLAIETSRRQVPRLKVPKGSVIIGGSHAGVQPVTAPSGWHLLGTTDVNMFDPHVERPCLLQPGDRVRFEVKALLT